jgi:hypothetical protein
MNESVFVEVEFFVLTLFSLLLPVSIYAYMMWKKAISRKTVLLFGVILIALSGINVLLMQRLAEMAKMSPSLLDDRIFASELSVALYLLPAVFAGIGVNLMSHILIGHLSDAERQFDREHDETNDKGSK